MGMFDSINLTIKCPRCGKESLMEAQTKELDCALDVFVVGQPISDQYNYLDCITECCIGSCMEASRDTIGRKRFYNGMFNVRIFIEDGKVSGRYKILPEK